VIIEYHPIPRSYATDFSVSCSAQGKLTSCVWGWADMRVCGAGHAPGARGLALNAFGATEGAPPCGHSRLGAVIHKVVLLKRARIAGVCCRGKLECIKQQWGSIRKGSGQRRARARPARAGQKVRFVEKNCIA
jgi:hypothetical protein